MTEEFKRNKKILVNVITISRIFGALLMIPFFYIWGGAVTSVFCLVFFLTDLIDGRLARKYGVQSFFGALMDAVCDKVFVITAFVLLATRNLGLLIPILLELLIAIIMIINNYRRRNVQTNMLGKIKLNVMAVSIVISFLVVDYNIYILYILFLPMILIQLATFLTYAFKKDYKAESFKENDRKAQVVKSLDEITKDMLDTEFYLNNKDGGLKQLFLKDDEW